MGRRSKAKIYLFANYVACKKNKITILRGNINGKARKNETGHETRFGIRHFRFVNVYTFFESLSSSSCTRMSELTRIPAQHFQKTLSTRVYHNTVFISGLIYCVALSADADRLTFYAKYHTYICIYYHPTRIS